jgi:alginate O-acetyltransferase complex protein AlgI
MSYVIDVYRGKVKAQHDPVAFGAYVSMFPQLIAGPIVRYSDVERQLMKRNISWERFGEGSVWFLRGLGKKVLIANNIGSIYESIVSLGIPQMSALTAWIGCFAYTMQIYYDFGGYSDMAVGLGKMLGFDFMKNFDYPYISRSITEFWRRWHISLSSWFKEYVYIPLGGNRGGTLKAIRNLMIVWMLTGLWHGAAWNFIFWGLYYGIILCLEKYVLGDALERLPQAARHVYTMVLVMVGWVLFFSPSMGSAMSYLGAMFGIGGKGLIDMTGFYYLKSGLLLGIIAGIGSTPFLRRKFSELLWREERYMQIAGVVMYAGIFLISTAYLVNDTYNPFLYFRF